jgi:manganese/zinc-transporting P-type ATPase C
MSDQSKGTIAVQHKTIGRMRLNIPGLRTRPYFANAMEASLHRSHGVKAADARMATGSLIILFDPRTLTFEDVLEKVTETAALIKAMDREALAALEPETALSSTDFWGHQSIMLEAVKLVAMTGFIVFGLVRSIVFRSPLPGPFVAIATSVGMIPLALRGLADLGSGKGITLNLFLTSACVLAIGSGTAGAAIEIIWVSEVSRFLEEIIRDRSRRAVRDLLDSSTRSVFVLVDGVEVETSPTSVAPGDLISVRKGDRISVDGEIAQGEATLNAATLTGRAEPEYRTIGDKVLCGMVVIQGKLLIRAEKTGKETYESQTMETVERSLGNRAPVEIKADQLAQRVAKMGVLTTLLTFILTRDLGRTLAVQLIMACPCATALAASAAISAALGNAARNRTLIKGGLFLEKYTQSDCFCFDKTGALSDIDPTIEEIHTRSTWIETGKVISLAAAAEGDSLHPVAGALRKLSRQQEYSTDKLSDTEEILGRGVRAKIGNDLVSVGNLHFMQDQSVNVSYFKTKVASLRQRGLSVVYISRNNKALGIIGLTFKPRKSVRETIDGLRLLGIEDFHIISGDSEESVAQMATITGIDKWLANALPEDKADYVRKLEDSGKRVVMVGDGVNDTPALSKAFVGVAMGKDGAETAILVSDITIADSDPARLLELRKLGKETFRIIDRNYTLAFTSDLVAAGLVVLGILNPVAAGVIHLIHFGGIALSSLSLISPFPQNSSSVI